MEAPSKAERPHSHFSLLSHHQTFNQPTSCPNQILLPSPMEKAEDEVSLNSPIISDCDKHFSDKQLQAIETAFLSTASSSSIKNGRLPHSDDGCSGFGSNSRRRLSDSIILQVVDNRCRKFSNGESSSAQIYNSFALLPCPRNWGFHDGIPPGTAAVIQIRRNMTPCYIMHIIHSGMPQKLLDLLEDLSSLKDHNVSIRYLEDLCSQANQKLEGEPRLWSPSSMVEMLLKPNHIRLGNWESDVLSKVQLQFAATNAFASWYLYQVLKKLPG